MANEVMTESEAREMYIGALQSKDFEKAITVIAKAIREAVPAEQKESE